MKRFLLAAALWGVPGVAQSPAPSLLSRGRQPEAHLARAENLFRPYLGALSGYDNGPLLADLDRGGGHFQELEGGLQMQRLARRAELRLDYQFGLRHYTGHSRLDRSNHAFNLDARFQLSRDWALAVRDVGQSTSPGRSFQAPTAPSAGFFADAGPEIFQTRTIANTVLADLVYAPSRRTSITVAGDGFLVQRQFRALADAVGWRARADLAHRYSRHRTVSLAYSFTHFDHSRSFGGADYAAYALGHSWRLARRSELDVLAGAGLLRGAGVRTVTLDPEIARLLGTSRGVEIFRLHTWAPHLLAAWAQGIGRAELRAQFARLVADGGGLSGLARQNEGTLSLSTAHTRSAWRPAFHLAVRTYRSLDTLVYDSKTALAGGALARRLSPHAEVIARYDFTFYNFQTGLLRSFRRHQVAAGVVYTFAPGSGNH